MAVLMAPDFIDFAGSDEPKTMAVVVATANIMKPGAPAILTAQVLMYPSRDQIIGTSGAGYSQ